MFSCESLLLREILPRSPEKNRAQVMKAITSSISLVKLARDLIRFPGPLISVAFWEGKSPAISGKSRLVKYYSIWPDIWTLKNHTLNTTPQEVFTWMSSVRHQNDWRSFHEPMIVGEPTTVPHTVSLWLNGVITWTYISSRKTWDVYCFCRKFI